MLCLQPFELFQTHGGWKSGLKAKALLFQARLRYCCLVSTARVSGGTVQSRRTHCWIAQLTL